MNEDNFAAGFQREGEITFPTETNDEETGADSQSDKDNRDEGTHSPDGDTNNQDDKDTPFHEHPRWKQREDEWNKRFNDQEQRHQDDLKALREEFGSARKANEQNTKIPAWFGGTQEQWDAYRADRDAELKEAEERAIKRLTTEKESKEKAESDAVAEATAYMKSEITAIESDKVLNPTGAKIDQKTAEKLLKTVLDNELIDTKGRWNYRAGWRLMNGTTAQPVKKPDTTEKKEVAAATSSTTTRGEKKESQIATSDTFKKDRPW